MDGTGTLTLSNANIFTGALTISAGTIKANGNAGALGLGTLALNGGTLDFNHSALLAFNRATTVGGDAQIIAEKNVAGAGVTYTLTTLGIGANTLTVSGGNVTSGTAGLTFSGATTLSGAATFNIINPGTGTGVTQLSLAGVTNGAHTVTLKGNGNFSQTGVWGNGAGGLTLDSTYSGIAILSQSNTYSGTTTVNGGVLRLSGATALPGGIAATGGTSALTINGGYVELGNGNFLRGLGSSVAQVQITGGTSGFSANGGARIVNLGNASASVTWGSASFAPSTLVLNGTTANNTLDFQNPLDLGAGSRTVFVGVNTATMSGAISNGSLTKTGTGSLTLSSTSNGYTGATTVNAGTLTLSGSLASTVLNLGGATFSYTRTGTNTQTFTTTNITAGANTISNSVAGNTLGLGSIVRTVGGTVNFSNAGTLTTSTGLVNNILGGWATINNDNWASKTGSNITALGTYTVATTVAADYLNNNMDATTVTVVGNINTNSLRFSGASTKTLTLAAGDNIIQSGGILVRSDVAAGVSTITGGNLLGSASGDLIVHQHNATTALTISSIIKDNGTATGLTKSGAGTLVLQGAHTYTGDTFINGGTLLLGIVANTPATAASLGSGNYAGNIFIASGAILSQRTSSNQIFSGIISGGGSFSSVGSGTTTLSGNNTYTGTTTVAPQAAAVGGNTLSVSSFNSVFTNASLGTVRSTSSSLGAPTTVANGTITLGSGSVGNGSILRYTGTGETTDRVINLAFNNGGSGQTLTTNGTGLLKFVSAFTSNGSGTVVGTLTLNGTGNGEITQPLPALPSNAATHGLAKSGTGTWTLGGSYAANQTGISGGLLRFNGDITATGAFAVSSTGGISLLNNAVNTLNITSTLGITGGLSANNLYFDLGNATNTTDKIIAGAATSVTTDGAAVINLNQLGGTAGRNTAGTYTLIQGTTSMAVIAKFSLATTKAFGQTFTLGVSGNNLNLITTQVTSTVGNVTLSGTNPSWLVGGNFTGGFVPDYGSNVTIDSAIGTTGSLGASTNINSLNYGTSATTSTTITAGTAAAGTPFNMLVLEAGTANSNPTANGITVATPSSGTPTQTISANVGLASSQKWTVNTGGALTVSGIVSDFGGGYTLTKAGAGALTLSGANTFTGGLTISAGTVNATTSANALGGTGTGAVTLGDTTGTAAASLLVGTTGLTYSNPIILTTNPTVGILTIGNTADIATTTFSGGVTGSNSFTINNSSATSAARAIIFQLGNLTNTGLITNIGSSIGATTISSNITSANTGGVTQNSSGSLVLSGNNSYSGVTTISTGRLQFTKQASLYNSTPASWTAANIVVGATGTLALNVGGTNEFTTGNVTTLLTNLGGANGTSTTGFAAGSFIAFDTTNASGGTFTVADTIANSTGTGGGAIGVTKLGANTLTLSDAANSFTGAITLSSTTTSAGTLVYASAGGANAINFLQTTSTATLSYTGAAPKTISGAITASALTTGTITLDASGATASDAINYSNTASLGFAGSGIKNLILSGANTGTNTLAGAWVNNTGAAATLTKNGAGTWILAGNNTYTGLTSINQGTLQVNVGGTLGGITAPLTIGSGVAGTQTLNSVGNLILNTSATVGAITVKSNTSDTTTAANIGLLSIASGSTLTASSFTAGIAATDPNTNNTALSTGSAGTGGTLTVNGNFTMSQTGGASGSAAVTSIDLSGLNTFNVTATGGSLTVGSAINSKGTLTLANNANNINVGTLSVGDSGSSNYNAADISTINLGGGTNALSAPTLNIGAGKGAGIIQFAGSGGTVVITGANGVGTSAITIGNATAGTYQGASNGLLLVGHTATVSAGVVIVGRNAGNTGNAPTANVTFDTGTFGATSITLASSTTGSSATAPTASFTVGGATANSAATGVVNVSGNFLLAANTNSTAGTTGTATGSLIINGGTVNIGSGATNGIFDTTTSTTGSSSTTLTLAGGTLNLNGGLIGGTTGTGKKNITNLNFQSGTLQNVLQINDGAGLTKTTSGTLILSGINSYTGTTNVNQGILSVGTLAAPTGSINNSAVTISGGNFRYNSSTNYTNTLIFTTGTLSGTNWLGSLGGLTIGAGQTISPGNSPGTATTTSETWAAGGTYEWEINNVTATAGADPGWDLINGSGTLNITANAGNEFTIDVMSLTSLNVAGAADGFDDATSYSWMIANFFNAITGFSEDAFIIDTTQFAVHNAFTGTFGVALGNSPGIGGDNTEIWLTYTAIPEPKAALLGCLGVLLLLRRRR